MRALLRPSPASTLAHRFSRRAAGRGVTRTGAIVSVALVAVAAVLGQTERARIQHVGERISAGVRLGAAQTRAAWRRGLFGYQEHLKTLSATTNARTIRQVTLAYRTDHPGEACPTMDRLRDQGAIDVESKLTDPWNRPYRIACTREDVIVSSSGSDETWETEDDVLVSAASVRSEAL